MRDSWAVSFSTRALLVFLCACSLSYAESLESSRWKPVPEITDEFEGNKPDAAK